MKDTIRITVPGRSVLSPDVTAPPPPPGYDSYRTSWSNGETVTFTYYKKEEEK